MPDILQQLITILNINCSLINCYYTNPLEGLFYLVFFPSVFIILFIYILTGSVFKGAGGVPHGLRLLIGIAVFLFLIFQGWYTAIVSISKLWFILVIILGGLWWFIRAHFGKKEVKPGGGLPAVLGKYAGMPQRRFEAAVTGEKKTLKETIEEALGLMDAAIGSVKKGGDIEKSGFWNFYNQAREANKALSDIEPSLAARYENEIEKRVKRLREVTA